MSEIPASSQVQKMTLAKALNAGLHALLGPVLHLRERVLAMPDPEPVTMFDNVFPTGSPEVDAERAWFEQYQASFEGSAH